MHLRVEAICQVRLASPALLWLVRSDGQLQVDFAPCESIPAQAQRRPAFTAFTNPGRVILKTFCASSDLRQARVPATDSASLGLALSDSLESGGPVLVCLDCCQRALVAPSLLSLCRGGRCTDHEHYSPFALDNKHRVQSTRTTIQYTPHNQRLSLFPPRRRIPENSTTNISDPIESRVIISRQHSTASHSTIDATRIPSVWHCDRALHSHLAVR